MGPTNRNNITKKSYLYVYSNIQFPKVQVWRVLWNIWIESCLSCSWMYPWVLHRWPFRVPGPRYWFIWQKGTLGRGCSWKNDNDLVELWHMQTGFDSSRNGWLTTRLPKEKRRFAQGQWQSSNLGSWRKKTNFQLFWRISLKPQKHTPQDTNRNLSVFIHF